MEMRKLVLDILREIGCQPEVNKKGEISFMYQGENFLIRILSERIISIFDIWWANISLNDAGITNLKKAINGTNLLGIGPTVLYTIDEEEQLLGIHSIYSTGFFKEVSDLKDYMIYLLRCFFDVQQEVRKQYSALL